MLMANLSGVERETARDGSEVINLLLTSIALEGIGLSSILNSGGEKIKSIVEERCLSIQDALKISNSVEQILRTMIKDQMLIQLELEDTMGLGVEDIIGREEEVCQYFDQIS